MGKLSTVGKTLGSAAGARPSPSLTQTPTKYPLECGLLTLYLRKILLQMLHKNQVCIVECLIHRLSRKWRNMNKNLLSPLQRLFPELFTGGGSLVAPVNGFLHPGYCCLNPPSGQKGTSVQKCFDTSLANI